MTPDEPTKTDTPHRPLGCSLHGGVATGNIHGETLWIDCGPDVCGHPAQADGHRPDWWTPEHETAALAGIDDGRRARGELPPAVPEDCDRVMRCAACLAPWTGKGRFATYRMVDPQ